eukprot:jgi/Tetstr1/454265/TSEL_041184.t1
MPLFVLPRLTASTYANGVSVYPGDKVVPILVVSDGNGKVRMVRGDAVSVRDAAPPVIADFAIAQAAGGYTLAPSSGTVVDATREAVVLHHVVAAAADLSSADLLALVADGANAGKFGTATISSNTPGAETALPGLSGLATDQVYAGGAFRAIAEGDVVHSYLMAVNPASNTDNDGALVAITTAADGTLSLADRTPPTGLESVALPDPESPGYFEGSVTGTSAMLTGLDAIADGGDGVASITVTYGTSATLSDESNAALVLTGAQAPPGTYNISPLEQATTYHVWVSATDGINAAAAVKVGTVTTLDTTDPVIAGFNVSQDPVGYTFSATAGTVADNAAGDLQAFLVLATSLMSTEQLRALAGEAGAGLAEAGARNLAHAYPGGGVGAPVSGLGLSAATYHDGDGFVPVTEASPPLYAHLLVLDGSANANSAVNAGGAVEVADRTPPTGLESVALPDPGSPGYVEGSITGTSAVLTGLDAIADGGDGVASITVTYGTSATFEDEGNAAVVLTGAQAPPGTYTLSPLQDATTYHVWVSATDGTNAAAAVKVGTVTTLDLSDIWLFYGAGSSTGEQAINSFHYNGAAGEGGTYVLNYDHVTLYNADASISNEIRGVLPEDGYGSASDTAVVQVGSGAVSTMDAELESGFDHLGWYLDTEQDPPLLAFSVRIPTAHYPKIPSAGWSWNQGAGEASWLGSWVIYRNGVRVNHTGTDKPTGTEQAFRDIAPLRLLPALTANVDQGYTVSATSVSSENYLPYYAFSRTFGFYRGGWSSEARASPPHHVTIQMPSAVTAYAVRIWNTQSWEGLKVLSCDIEGSNDGANWTVLASFADMEYTVIPHADKATSALYLADFDGAYNEDLEVDAYVFQGPLANPGAYTHYRYLVTQQENSARVTTTEIVLL